MKNISTLLMLLFCISIIQAQTDDFEYFYHPSPYFVNYVCPNNGDYKIFLADKFASSILDVNSNNIDSSFYGTPTIPVHSYNTAYCDVAIGNFIEYDFEIPQIMHLNDRSSFEYDIYRDDTYPKDDRFYAQLNTIDIDGPTYLVSLQGGTYEIDNQGNIINSWLDILKGSFLRALDNTYILDRDNKLFKLNISTNEWDLVHEFEEEFKRINIITYDEDLNKHYLLDGNVWELEIGDNEASARKLVGNIYRFNVLNGILYFTQNNQGQIVKSYNLTDDSINDFYTTEPKIFVSSLSNNGEELLIGAHYAIYNEHSLPLLQVVKVGSNYNPDRVDFTIENLDIQKQVNFHFLVEHAADEFKNRANVDLTFTFDITNNGTETLTELTSYDDAVFAYGPKMHNHQLIVNIPSGETQTITYTRTTEIIAKSTKVNIAIPGANYKLDRDLSDNSLEFDINLASRDLDIDASGIYPNPVFDRLFIKDRSGLFSGQIYNTVGQLVHQFNEQDLSEGTNVSQLESGYYSIILNDSNGLNNSVFKFVKL